MVTGIYSVVRYTGKYSVVRYTGVYSNAWSRPRQRDGKRPFCDIPHHRFRIAHAVLLMVHRNTIKRKVDKRRCVHDVQIQHPQIVPDGFSQHLFSESIQ